MVVFTLSVVDNKNPQNIVHMTEGYNNHKSFEEFFVIIDITRTKAEPDDELHSLKLVKNKQEIWNMKYEILTKIHKSNIMARENKHSNMTK